MTVAHKERKKWILGFTYNHHIQPSGGRECLPEDKSAFRDLIQRSGDIKMAFSRVMQKKKKREREKLPLHNKPGWYPPPWYHRPMWVDIHTSSEQGTLLCTKWTKKVQRWETAVLAGRYTLVGTSRLMILQAAEGSGWGTSHSQRGSER